MKTALFLTASMLFAMTNTSFAAQGQVADPYLAVLNDTLTLEGQIVDRNTDFDKLIELTHKYNDRVWSVDKGLAVNLMDLGDVLVFDYCSVSMTKEDIYVWINLSVKLPEVDNNEWFSQHRCAHMQTIQSVNAEAVEDNANVAITQAPAFPLAIEATTMVIPVSTNEGADSTASVDSSFDFQAECSGYTGKFWQWRLSKCLEAVPGWSAPALGATL
jgi:hypothetical protein